MMMSLDPNIRRDLGVRCMLMVMLIRRRSVGIDLPLRMLGSWMTFGRVVFVVTMVVIVMMVVLLVTLENDLGVRRMPLVDIGSLDRLA